MVETEAIRDSEGQPQIVLRGAKAKRRQGNRTIRRSPVEATKSASSSRPNAMPFGYQGTEQSSSASPLEGSQRQMRPSSRCDRPRVGSVKYDRPPGPKHKSFGRDRILGDPVDTAAGANNLDAAGDVRPAVRWTSAAVLGDVDDRADIVV